MYVDAPEGISTTGNASILERRRKKISFQRTRYVKIAGLKRALRTFYQQNSEDEGAAIRSAHKKK